ncbi:histidine--tRNA ligase [Luminiphilus sp.]|nr:histidine--tRNA ligase [Luminiphilus sp.]MDB2377007.1 histidine--tRNA ligase [Luminiphilus sp.]MDC3405838.1 histidine--tRNA ligase [Luminiphilus sp.]MDC6485944.1 histidine--tRNA ligase [Luminiphilus sp.]
MTDYRSVRGMVDILPEDSFLWQQLEGVMAAVLQQYGYQEIRLPIIETTQLFSRSIGEVTDIVEKEMYTFADRNDESLSLRPEGTAGCVRAVVQHNLQQTVQKLWYQGPMFRYERPQKGRQRQFHQLGVEGFGVASPDLDAELILLSNALWRGLGVQDLLTLEINSIGSPHSRALFREALVVFLSDHRDGLDDDSQRRLVTNPLRILDSKNAATQALLADAPSLSDFIDDESRDDFAALLAMLTAAGQPYVVNERLVRGLDYYNKTVFEWTTDALGAQGTVCGGGRYDGLVAQFGGRDTPAAGFAIGLERLVLLIKGLDTHAAPQVDIYVVTADTQSQLHALPRVEALRRALPNKVIQAHLGGGSFKSQFKRADRSGAQYALVYGESEQASESVTLKPLRSQGEQITLPDNQLAAFLAESLAGKNGD